MHDAGESEKARERSPGEGSSRWLPADSASTRVRDEGTPAVDIAGPGPRTVEADSVADRASRRISVPTWAIALSLTALGGLIAAIVILVASDNGSAAPASAPPRAALPAPKTSSQPTSATPGARSLRDPFEVDGIRWAVFANPDQPWTSFTRTRNAGEGRRWLTISVRLRNLDRSDFKPLRLPFVLTSKSGAGFTPDPRFGAGLILASGAPSVAAEKTGQVELAYRVPRSATRFTLRFASRAFGGTPIAVDIKAP